MAEKDKASNPDGAVQPEKKSSIASRSIFALAFAWVGSHLFPIGTIIDGHKLLEHEPNKFRAMFNGTLVKKITGNDQETRIIPAVAKNPGKFKYTLIVAAVGAVLGAVLGWVRGNHVGSVKEVVFHPIKALKEVFGAGSKTKEPEKSQPAAEEKVVTTPELSSDNTSRWRERADQQQQQAAAVVR